MKVFLWLALGVCGALLCGGAYFFCEIGKGFSHWGETVVYADREAKETITQRGIPLPEGVHDVHYAIEGFQDHLVLMKFSVPTGAVWQAVEAITKKKQDDFTDGTSDTWLDPIPQHPDQHLDLMWWNPHQIAHPRSWSLKDEKGEEVVTVDEEKSVIYLWFGDA